MPFPTARRATLISVLGLLAGGVTTASADATGGVAPTVAASTPALPEEPVAAKVPQTRTVRLTRSQIKTLQRRANVRADGKLGAETRKALRRYQANKRLARTGRPNLQTLKAMRLGFAATIERRMTAQTLAHASDSTAGFTFPIQGAWSRGGAATTFGARSGAHDGIDLLSSCGTPVVAASAGTVKANKTQSAAGYYVVISDTPSGEDQVYMHLQTRSPLNVGDRVEAGSSIGAVGDTGNATACLLHFELWSAPGWYDGGRPRDPGADLARWDQASPAGTRR